MNTFYRVNYAAVRCLVQVLKIKAKNKVGTFKLGKLYT